MVLILSFLLSFFGTDPQTKPLVVVELFTSEGCSSCPPADKLLSEIVNKQDADVEILALSFHVDYWDYIGWKDPYANADYTSRQRVYARKFRNRSIYTPQMVVNGKYEFVGSRRAIWKAVLAEAPIDPGTYDLDASIEAIGKKVTVKVNSTVDKTVLLNVALVERGLSQDVSRGENRGRKLSHDNVVRAHTSRQFDGQTTTFKLDVPKDLDPSKSRLIVYAQEEDTWAVVGAIGLPIN